MCKTKAPDLERLASTTELLLQACTVQLERRIAQGNRRLLPARPTLHRTSLGPDLKVAFVRCQRIPHSVTTLSIQRLPAPETAKSAGLGPCQQGFEYSAALPSFCALLSAADMLTDRVSLR